MTDKLVEIGLYITYFLLIISVVIVIVMPLISAFGDIKSLLKGLIGIGMIVAVFLLAFAFSSGEVPVEFVKFGIGSLESRVIGAGLLSMYILLIVSFIGIFVSEIVNIFK